MRACADCGEPTENYGRCDECRPVEPARPERGTTSERGYGTAWRKLSERARRMQRWCLDCGATTDLTVDHLPIAWERYNAGKPVRLCDVEVVCRRCNSRRGAARPSATRSDPRGDARTPRGRDPRGKAKFASRLSGPDSRRTTCPSVQSTTAARTAPTTACASSTRAAGDTAEAAPRSSVSVPRRSEVAA